MPRFFGAFSFMFYIDLYMYNTKTYINFSEYKHSTYINFSVYKHSKCII